MRKNVTYQGYIIKGDTEDYYEVRQFCDHLCHRDHMCRQIKNYPEPTVSWGYEGNGPAQLAVMLVAVAAHYGNYLDLQNICYADWLNETRLIVAKHHEDFMREFVATWGDRWTITTDEILNWINKREQPKEQNEQTKPANQTSAED